jgi:hypothetical protein
MPSAASKSISSGVRPTISPSRSAPTSVRCTARCRMGSSMLSRAARISSTVQMVRSCVDFLGLSTRTGLLTRMPHSTGYWKAVPSSRCTSWMVVPERNRCFCFSVNSCFLPSIYEPQVVLLRVVYTGSRGQAGRAAEALHRHGLHPGTGRLHRWSGGLWCHCPHRGADAGPLWAEGAVL